jgi:TRAP-type transport system small permease protein
MIWIAYLGAGLALRENRHVAIELLQDRLPAALGRKLRMAVGGLALTPSWAW